MSARGPVPEEARSFDRVADAYDSARPGYPVEAVPWLVGPESVHVLELGAGTGKLTETLVAAGHTVTATDPSPQMLRRLVRRAPAARILRSAAEQIPLPARSVDVVVAAQAYHWFDAELALPEIARVLRPGGHLALVWNRRDERIPWVKRLGAIIGDSEQETLPVGLEESGLFGDVESTRFRFWQPLTQQSLRDLVSSRSTVATRNDLERERLLRKVDELYDGYGRGADGMLLPYVTHAFRATVVPRPDQPAEAGDGPDDLGTDALLIDFR